MQTISKRSLYVQETPLEMQQTGKEPRTKKRRVKSFSRLRPFIIVAVVSYSLIAFGGLKLELHRADTQILALEQEKARLLQEQQRLLDYKEKINSPIYIERRARESLGFIKQGEKVLVPAQPGEVMSLKLEGINEIGD